MGITHRLSLDTARLAAFARATESKYNRQPYHNSMHAADVVHAIYIMILMDEWGSLLSDTELLALIVAAAVHDIGHPGVNNDFHARTNSESAQRYGHVGSINERCHARVALDLLEDPSLCFVEPMGEDAVEAFKKTIEELVLCTDMAQHGSLVERFVGHIGDYGASLSQWPTEKRKTALKMLLHCADISNPARPLGHCTEWGTRVQEELYCQGEKELALGLTVTPACDRQQGSLYRSQAAFIKHVMKPCILQLSSFAPSFVSMTVPYIDSSLTYWRMRGGDSGKFSVVFRENSGKIDGVDPVSGAVGGDTAVTAVNTNGDGHCIVIDGDDDDLSEREVSTELIASIAP